MAIIRQGNDKDAKTETKNGEAKNGETKKGADKKAEPHKGDPKFFDGAVVKIDADGNEVLSDHLDEGEMLRSDVSDKYRVRSVDL